MQKINFLTLSTIASLVLIGCGSSSSTTSTTNTGTGYYKDSAVAGVDYVCGTKIGKTDKDGKFTFEKGKECKFSLAGIPLRTTPADKLTDGGTVLEDNPKVAKFLQSIDTDGDLSNGIEIDDKVLEALTSALENIDDDTTVLSDDTVLTSVVAEVGSQVSGVSGAVRTDSEVQEHLNLTQTEITKELLAGKTFYVVGEDGEDNKAILFKVVVNADATAIKSYKLDGTLNNNSNIKVVGNKMIFTEDTDGAYTLISQENGYVFADDRNGDGTKSGTIGHRLYANEADAKKYLDSLATSTASSDLEKLIVGKTYYVTSENSYTDENGNVVNNNHVETLTFNADGKIGSSSWVENGERKSITFNYSVQGDTFNLNGTDGEGDTFNETFKAPLTETDEYISFSGHDGRFYKTYALAELALNNR